MPVLTYQDIVNLTQEAQESFSQENYQTIVRSCERDVILARLLQA